MYVYVRLHGKADLCYLRTHQKNFKFLFAEQEVYVLCVRTHMDVGEKENSKLEPNSYPLVSFSPK